MRGRILPVMDLDVHACYPAGFSLLGCWDILRASEVRERPSKGSLLDVVRPAARGDLSPLFDPDTYRNLGLCLAEVLPDGESWPVEVVDEQEIPHFFVRRMRSQVPMFFAWPDVVHAALGSGRVPHILSATRLVPAGSERVRSLPLRDGVVVRPGVDPVPVGVRMRTAAQAVQDDRLSGQLRVYLNGLVWGLFAQTNQHRISGGRGRRSVLVEEVGEWNWPPIAATVPAVARMWMGMVGRHVSDRGGLIVTRDTDGLTVLASPGGGTVTVGEGRSCRALPWSVIDEFLTGFDRLDPFGDGSPFWKVDRGTRDRPLHVLSLGPKRYVMAQRGPDGWEVVGGTEHSLGGGVVDPPGLAGRDDDRRHMWTFPVARYALDQARERTEP